MTKEELEKALGNYIPSATVSPIASLVIDLKVHLRITKERSSKLGDYRAPSEGKGHRISINHNLNQYAFFITLVHELAHLVTWNHFQHKVNPHGHEWKRFFKELMLPFQDKNIFPSDIELALRRYLKSPAASSCSDPALQKVLSCYDSEPVIHLDDIPPGARFGLNNGMVFIKGEKRRTRYRCIEEKSGKAYLVSGIAEIELL